jgi:hypothetical protein
MKNLLLGLVMICAQKLAFSQNNSNVKLLIGQGLFQGAHAGISYNHRYYAIGVSYGKKSYKFPYEDGKGEVFSIDNNLYFRHINKFSYPSGYIYFNLQYLVYDEYVQTRTMFPLNLGIGKEFYLSKNIGIAVQGGTQLIFLGKTKYKVINNDLKFWIYPIMPDLAVRVFIRIN